MVLLANCMHLTRSPIACASPQQKTPPSKAAPPSSRKQRCLWPARLWVDLYRSTIKLRANPEEGSNHSIKRDLCAWRRRDRDGWLQFS
jgi:hypothetical protein